jgi:hypothetical protein
VCARLSLEPLLVPEVASFTSGKVGTVLTGVLSRWFDGVKDGKFVYMCKSVFKGFKAFSLDLSLVWAP